MIWGEVSSFINKQQDHSQEIERMQLQKDLDDAAHARDIETLKLQNQLGLQTIQAQGEAAVSAEEAKAFTTAMADAFKPTGYPAVDVWNGVIRPAAATIVLGLWIAKLWTQKGVMDDWDTTLAGTILGFFFADRSLAKRNK